MHTNTKCYFGRPVGAPLQPESLEMLNFILVVNRQILHENLKGGDY